MASSKKQTNMPEKKLSVEPLTRAEMREASHKRVSLIAKELAEGFEFIEDYPKSVTFFGSSQINSENEYYKKAVSLAKKISKTLGYSILTGGGPGIMEAANRGAFEAEGSSVGITIELPHEQVMNSYLTDYIPLYYFFTRKVCLSFAAEAYVFFPGGFGTLDELFELLTLIQTNKIVSIPIILVGSEYWNPLKVFLEKEVLSRGMIEQSDFSIFTIEDDEEKIVEIISKVPVRSSDGFPELIKRRK